MAEKPLYIADGHHRYESALLYKHEREAAGPSNGNEGYNYVMMTLIEFNDPGLLIFPPHRLIRGVSKASLHELINNCLCFLILPKCRLVTKTLAKGRTALLVGGLGTCAFGGRRA